MTVAVIPYIAIDDKGVARIAGTRLKVIHLAAMIRGWDMSVEQIIENFPDFAPAKILAALSYYYDHKAELDAQMDRDAADNELALQEQKKSAQHHELLARRREHQSKQ